MSAWDRLSAAWRAFREADPADTVDTITTTEELSAYEAGMKSGGRYSDEVMRAIERRAVMLNNRDRAAAARYVAKHETLARGRA